ncbi:hypothetical protein PIB30_079956 [Stylosanthes scabra]|uniref:SWIM-type domain-containing protein n=1 Tax=Stylosanthes scabra TaxID=79078 RepID=A0ABU6WU21_9FABA|nr:hypothetical protein [Stylosanthes scabra]
MPCVHAVAAVYKLGLKPKDFVHKWLTMNSIRTIYSHFIRPVNSAHYWTSTGAPKTLLPPIKRPAHRPAKKRRVDVVAERDLHANKDLQNPPLDPNWRPLTKKERRAAKGKSDVSTSKAKDTTQVDLPAVHDSGNEKAKKNKKKMPLKPGVRVNPLKQRTQSNKIPISQNAPNVEENQNPSQNLDQGVECQSSYAQGIQATSRMKQPIIRPNIPPTTTIGDNIQSLRDNGPRGVSAETLAATSSGTAIRLFKYMPTPGFKPLGRNE